MPLGQHDLEVIAVMDAHRPGFALPADPDAPSPDGVPGGGRRSLPWPALGWTPIEVVQVPGAPPRAMTDPRPALRQRLASLDARQRKIVGGVLAVMIENPERVREREWISEQFTQVVLLACGFEDVGSVQEAVERVQGYAREQIDPLLSACYELFTVTAEDLAPRVREGVTREEALAHALDYLGQDPAAGDA